MVWIIVLVVVVAVILALGYLLVSSGKEDAAKIREAISTVKPEQIQYWSDECVKTFRSKLGKQPSLSDIKRSSSILDEALADKHRDTTRLAFYEPGFVLRYVLPIGAFLGELVRANVSATWKESQIGPSAGLALEVEGGFTMHPFDKVLKMLNYGDPGDLAAYVWLAISNKKA